MPQREDFLVEIGSEELPPKSLCDLARAFRENLLGELEALDLAADPERARWFAAPRRLAILIEDLPVSQPDREEQRLGPNVAAAYDDDGHPTRAAEGFARSCGVGVAELQRIETDKGERLGYTRSVAGRPAGELLVDAVDRALARLPVPRPMRWGNFDYTFVRPVHWVVMLLGDDIVAGELIGQRIGRESRGHRFHHSGAVSIRAPEEYLDTLREAHVLAEFEERRQRIADGVRATAESLDAQAELPEALLEEVTNLVEWPSVVAGEFDQEFLEVPAEALISSMETHQKFFPLTRDQTLLPRFIGVANIDSCDPGAVARGYSKVIRPRLADARFFWDVDRRTPLEARRPALESMVYQKQLGSLWDKSLRVRELAVKIADELGVEPQPVARAAELAKCDLLTEMVGEFPELQGIMGRYYAAQQGEDDAVAQAIAEHYYPRFAGDRLPATPEGRVLAIADRADTLAGIFAVGQRPTGNKDPFALRRAALGLARLLIEAEIDLDLQALFRNALAAIAGRLPEAADVGDEVIDFVFDRMRAYYAERHTDTEVFNAVLAARPTRPLDFDRRIAACREFAGMDAAGALAAANKRIGNILRKAETPVPDEVDPALASDPAERELAAEVNAAEKDIAPLLAERAYRRALVRLSELRPVIDRFFDEVLVMADDPAVRDNRLALLARLKGLFDSIADISQLAQAR